MYHSSIERLKDILDELREKCPWDRKQTLHSLSTQTIEELYELTDALAAEDWPNIREELGDILLHLMFYSKIASEQQQFEWADVIENVCNKLVRRHPHIFETTRVKDEAEVKQNWEQLKLAEGKKSVLQGVPASLPALVKAYRIQDKARQVGFDWDDIREVLAKVHEELGELREAIEQDQDPAAIEEEFGDVLFALVNYGRHLHIDPEQALEKTNKKFKKRFELMEQQILEDRKDMKGMPLPEMDRYWEQAKIKLQNK
ncbi:MAG: nucleoside triphosphate pyrophosphohydrolase [Bacteroidetes bacterium 47-18]|nr:MAG: nucleoside triphosphate pyrophosphohydrolase [Bacteroidetes bacterium 47-18]